MPERISLEEAQRQASRREWEQRIEDRLDSGSRRMDLMQAELGANTEITQEVRDILAAARVGLRVLGGIGAMARWVAAIGGGASVVWGAAEFIKKLKSGG